MDSNLKNSFSFIYLVLSLDILVITLTSDGLLQIQYLLGLIGAITFLGSMVAINILTNDSTFNKGSIRKAMTISSFVVYFLMLGITISGKSDTGNTERAKFVSEHFTYVMEFIISFYFGAKIVDKIVDRKDKKDLTN